MRKLMPISEPTRDLGQMIFALRDQRVILDSDLAALYDVSTGRLNEPVKRNADRSQRNSLFSLPERNLPS